MKKTVYFAVFEPTNTGYSVYFPDLPGCITVGSDIDHSIKMAKEALGLHLWGMEKDNDPIPAPTAPPFEGIEASAFTVPIEVYMDIVKNVLDNRATKKTLTIPYWLNAEAEQKGINFSHVLQSALKEVLHVD